MAIKLIRFPTDFETGFRAFLSLDHSAAAFTVVDLTHRRTTSAQPDPSGGGQEVRRFSIRQGRRIEKSPSR